MLRNDALHGNPIPTGRLIVAPAKQPLHQFAAPLYRMILTAYLDLKLAPRKPVAGLTKYESFRLDHFESGEYQRNIEAGLSTIMYTAEEYRARRQGDAWARSQSIKKAIEEVEEEQGRRRLDLLEEHPVHQRLGFLDLCPEVVEVGKVYGLLRET
ncbi:hypothetical protein QA641_39270 [Bradyrhizobium sp. CB1650]|uniref:hypothetical protein n=1 Tax=Bradyrhizobium sp. CB1650 TaxID=3039153 RepID=UPI002434DAE3|nr:hypothetical protein [Bradyrhizobium sp. CB1650]WGD51427.1 hypothetical protein QA641_39270 [Bradyrhizobium sp. CB1650]